MTPELLMAAHAYCNHPRASSPAKRLIRSLLQMSEAHRWNIEPHADGSVSLCMHDHEKGEDCNYERYVPAHVVDRLRGGAVPALPPQLTSEEIEALEAISVVDLDGKGWGWMDRVLFARNVIAHAWKKCAAPPAPAVPMPQVPKNADHAYCNRPRRSPAMTEDLRDLIGDYYAIGVREGREGRVEDDPDGNAARVWSSIQDKLSAIERENFALAAGQCAEATSDESGTPRCKRIAELEAKIGRLSDGSVPDDATMAPHLGGQMSWQPIETAPQDETQFLGWNGSWMDRTWVGWHDGTGPVYVYADYVSWKPTHWMSLPEPPK